VVIEGTFDTLADTEACWAGSGTGGSWTDAANVSPISGGYALGYHNQSRWDKNGQI